MLRNCTDAQLKGTFLCRIPKTLFYICKIPGDCQKSKYMVRQKVVNECKKWSFLFFCNRDVVYNLKTNTPHEIFHGKLVHSLLLKLSIIYCTIAKV